MQKTIFVTDDNDINLFRAKDALKDYYNVLTFPSAAKMFKMLDKITPDLILLDIKMPEIDGFEAMEYLKSNEKYESIPVIFLTASGDEGSEIKSFESGACDFVTKPFTDSVLLNRIRLHIDVNEVINMRTFELEERTNQLEAAHKGLILVLSDVVESRDKETGGHVERTISYIKLLADAMFKHGVYSDLLSNWSLEMFSEFALLHDIGKIGVSDVILNKPGALTPDEYEIMKSHVIKGEQIIDRVISRTGGDTFLNNAKLFVLCHHENWDGTGYPNGLKGEEIPLQGRVMAIADVYDALISDRPYKKGMPHEEAVDIIVKGSGKRFDPKIIDVFIKIENSFKNVAKQLA